MRLVWLITEKYQGVYISKQLDSIQPESRIHSTKTDQLFRKENETPGRMCFKYAKFRIERVNPFVWFHGYCTAHVYVVIHWHCYCTAQFRDWKGHAPCAIGASKSIVAHWGPLSMRPCARCKFWLIESKEWILLSDSVIGWHK
jgi:hypothetical protein